MAAFNSALISFPYLDAPGSIFDTTVTRLDLLRGHGPLPAVHSDLLKDVTAWLCGDGGTPAQPMR